MRWVTCLERLTFRRIPFNEIMFHLFFFTEKRPEITDEFVTNSLLSKMLKHMARSGPDHLRTPSNGLSDSGASDHVARRLLTTMPNAMHLANGYVSPGRYSQAAGSKMISQQQQQPQLHVSLLNTSKHSLSPTTSVSPGTANHTKTTLSHLDQSRDDSLPLNFSSSGNGPLCSSLYIPDRSMPNHSILSNRYTFVPKQMIKCRCS